MRHETALAERGNDGSTVREHLEARAAKGDVKAQDRLAGPERPPELDYLWEWFIELSRARSVGPHGLNPISYVDIEAWARLTGAEPDALEVDALMLIDRATQEKPDRQQTKPPSDWPKQRVSGG